MRFHNGSSGGRSIRDSRLLFTALVFVCWLLALMGLPPGFALQLMDVDKLPPHPEWLNLVLRFAVLYWAFWLWIACVSLSIYLFRRRIAVWVLGSAPIALIVPGFFAMLIICCNGPATYVENGNASGVPAAVDLETCEILAREQFESSDASRAARNRAVHEGRIVELKNGTDVDQGKYLDFEGHHLTPYKPTGPITVGEEVRRHLGVFEWMTPSTGPYKGKPLCVSESMKHARYAMP